MKESVKSSKGTTFQPKETGLMKKSFGWNPLLSWRDLILIVSAVIFAHQSTQMASFQSQLDIYEGRIGELERSILNNNNPSSNSLIFNEIENENNKTSSAVDMSKEKVVVEEEEEEHAPHSHYAIEMIDGVPVNPGIDYGFANAIG